MPVFTTDARLVGVEYQIGRFSDVYPGAGPLIWEFLCRADNVIRMETATYLERAAVEPLGAILLQKFGSSLNQDRYRQMIGHMVRQIMEAAGYELDRSSLRLTRLNMFTTGAAYRLKNGGRDRSVKIEREDRDLWASEQANTPFNAWIAEQAWNETTQTWDVQALHSIATEFGEVVDGLDITSEQLRLVVGGQVFDKWHARNQAA